MVKTSVKTDKKVIQRSGNKALYKQAKYTLNREIRVTKKNYSGKQKKSFQVTTLHQCAKAGKPSPATRPHPPALRPINNWLKTWTSSTAGLKTKAWSNTPHPLWPSHNTAIHTLPLPPHYGSQPVIKICEEYVSKVFRTHLPIDLQQITGAVWSPLLLQTLHHHPCTQ